MAATEHSGSETVREEASLGSSEIQHRWIPRRLANLHGADSFSVAHSRGRRRTTLGPQGGKWLYFSSLHRTG
jgi:hypothetical protein